VYRYGNAEKAERDVAGKDKTKQENDCRQKHWLIGRTLNMLQST